jgi:ABC-type nickel/cobalt efflux system permease component RcnA
MSKTIADNLQDLTGATQEYIEATIKYHKLALYKKIMLSIVSSVHKQLIAFTALLSFIFLSFGLAIYLGELMGSTYLGYLSVGLLYFLLCMVVTIFLKPVVEKIVLRNSSLKWFNDNKTSKNEDYEESI